MPSGLDQWLRCPGGLRRRGWLVRKSVNAECSISSRKMNTANPKPLREWHARVRAMRLTLAAEGTYPGFSDSAGS